MVLQHYCVYLQEVIDSLKLKDAVYIDEKGFRNLNFKANSRFEEILVYFERILSKEK